MDNREIFAFLADGAASGRRTALVSLVAASGTSMRAPGAHLAVAEDGAFVGSLSGGCIERAVVAEAAAAIAAGQPRVTRFGQGSRYIDIRLPCGGGVDLHFQPLSDPALANAVLGAIAARRPFALELTTGAAPPRVIPEWRPTGWSSAQGRAIVGHWPNPRLLIVGHGETLAKLAGLGRNWGAEIALVTPDQDLAERLVQNGFEARILGAPGDTGALVSDAWTAAIFLFHDHDWEPALIAHMLDLPHFFIGAMGSQRAHAARCAALRAAGVSDAAISGIAAPIGAFHSVRDPATLALSVLAQVAERFRHHDAFAASPPVSRPAPIRQIG